MTDSSCWDNAPERFGLAPVYHAVAEVIGWDAAIDFGVSVWQEKRPPSRVKSRGRGSIYIPNTLSERHGNELVRLAGRDNAALLVQHFRGSALEFPNIVSTSIGRRNRAIVEQIEQGLSERVVACSFGLSDRQIRNITKNGNRQNVDCKNA